MRVIPELLGWCMLFIMGLHPSQCEKIPSWRGPDTFFLGSMPPKRESHGFTSCDDGRVYVFGGFDELEGEIT
jgi:hypothetical protein